MKSPKPSLRLVPAALLLAAALLGAPPAGATPPRGAEVLALAAKAQTAPRWVRANFVERRPGSAGAAAGSLALRLAFSPSGAIRLDVERLGAVRSVDTTLWGGSQPGARPLAQAPGWLQVLAGRPVAEVARDKGVDPKITSLAHAGPIILWVLGAGPRDSTLPQLAIDRSSGRLVRFTDRAGDGDAPGRSVTVELGWPAAADAPFPDRISIAQDGAPAVVLGLSFVSVGDPLDDDLFAPRGATLSP